MAGVVERKSNSVRVKIIQSKDYSEWQDITVAGSVVFAWRVLAEQTMMVFIKFSKKIPSDKVNYIVTYTHWENMHQMGTAVMRIHSDNFGAVYWVGNTWSRTTITVEISTAHLSPCAINYDAADFMLRGEDGSVSFHKEVLATHSSVFETMLAGEWKETSEGVIDVPGTSEEMLQHLRIYMYSGKLPEKPQVDCLKQLLLLSSCYLIEDLKLRCLKELRFLLTIENVSDMIQFAMDNKVKLLHVETMDCAAYGDIDMKEVHKLVEAEDATLLQCE